GVRQEFSRPGPAGSIPGELVRLLTAYHRGVSLSPATTMRTVRRAYELHDADERVLAEGADDTVTVLEGRRATATLRESDAGGEGGAGRLRGRVGERLRAAGAVEGDFVPKHVRAMGSAANAAPDLAAPAGRLPANATAATVVTNALRRDIGQIFTYDPLVRLREPLPDGDTAVHQMRVACRRLRSDLRPFRALLHAPS